mmetsp:Transcript_55969/g.64622  ORF Transcript_55969/g.64622 Transcript_55969/m.64622 type:complete len:100 (-) Transcript_55969:918-1217(-)
MHPWCHLTFQSIRILKLWLLPQPERGFSQLVDIWTAVPKSGKLSSKTLYWPIHFTTLPSALILKARVSSKKILTVFANKGRLIGVAGDDKPTLIPIWCN